MNGLLVRGRCPPPPPCLSLLLLALGIGVIGLVFILSLLAPLGEFFFQFLVLFQLAHEYLLFLLSLFLSGLLHLFQGLFSLFPVLLNFLRIGLSALELLCEILEDLVQLLFHLLLDDVLRFLADGSLFFGLDVIELWRVCLQCK